MAKRLVRLLAGILATGILLSFGTVFADTASSQKTLGGKELRGVFVDSLNNKDFPSAPGLSESELKKELDGMITFAAQNKLNAVFFKVCASGDALYHSKVFPVSYYLTGKQGATLTFDPLSYLCAITAKQGIRVFAWIDPVRATLGTPDYEDLSALEKHVDRTQGYVPPQLSSARGDNLPQNALAPNSPAAQHPEYLINGDGGAKYYDIANPAVRTLFADAAAELASGYAIDGVLLETDVYPKNLDDTKSYTKFGGTSSIDEFRQNNVTALVDEVSKRVAATKKSLFFGVAATSDAYTLDNSYDTAGWIQSGIIDYIIPRLYTAIGYGADDYKTRIEGWKGATYGTPVLLMPAINSAALGDSTQSGGSYMDPAELMYQIMMARSCYSDGHVYSDSTSLMKNPLDLFDRLTRLYLDSTLSDRTGSFAVSGKLAVTRPGGNISINTSTYFLMGTSNPNQDLYVNGELVTNRAPGGSFGVFLNIPVGSTAVTVTQGDKTITRTIKRASASTDVSKITKITQSSMLPSSMGVVNSGQSYEVKCIAPSGGVVTAKIGDSVCTLKQVAATAENGVPATYKGTLSVSGGYAENRTTNLGKVTYTLQYAGNTTSFTSTGDLFYIGANTTASVRVLDDITLIYKTADAADSMTNLRKNTTDYILDETDTMFKLSMGGYVKKSAVTMVEGETVAAPQLKGITLEKDNDGEGYVLKGGAGIPFVFSRSGSEVSVSLYNLKGLTGIDVSQSGLFSSCTVSGQTATFTVKSSASLWGYSLSYRGNDAVLYFKKAPVKAGGASKPLEGITVVLDPGHGGVDPGALGPVGDKGAMEKHLTLAVAQKARTTLQELGAQVYLTRQSDNGVTQADRAGLGERVKADFFVSVHFNSTAESANSSKSTGVEVYYYTSASSSLASNLLNQLSSQTGRKARDVYRSTYVVTRTYYAPSVLCELGFLSNPSEYEQMLSSADIDRAANALAQGILNSL